jgi:hypothetical protein
MSTWVGVDVSDITNRWRPLEDFEADTAPTMIQDAQDILEDALEELGFTGAPVPQNERWERKYVRVVATMVKRVLSNPDGLLTETTDDYTYRRDSAVSAGVLYLSDDELASLSLQPRRRRGSFTITPS